MNRTKKPDNLPMIVANIVKVDLRKKQRSKHIKLAGYNLYQFDLRFSNSGRRYGTEYVWARSHANALKRIREQYPFVIGVASI